ncbi:MAG: hypothetical protein KDE09_00185 [Anaerolineales bacterium]|nr:hypothetical protein [Anaerolineales bacterium]
MMTEKTGSLSSDQTVFPAQKLLVSGLIRLGNPEAGLVELRRGMAVVDRVGHEAGTVAAVVLDCARKAVTHVLLGHLPLTADYRLIPLTLIDRINEETVWLSITGTEIETLPTHQPD